MEKEIKKFLLEKKGYLKKSNEIVLQRLGILNPSMAQIDTCKKVKAQVQEELENIWRNYPKNNILVIGDLHEPFCLDGYLEFCKKIQNQQKCGKVIFIGDIIDNHYSSYHETVPDGFGAGEELDRAIHKLSKWYKAFPEASVMIGNHDRLISRKAQSSGLSQRWLKDLNEVLEVPQWEFTEELVIDNVCYNHGEGGTARTRMKNEMQSQVQGHRHSEFYLDYIVSPTNKIFGMQVGCGVDRKQYGMSYGKKFKKPVIGCATVEKGVPHLHPMEL